MEARDFYRHLNRFALHVLRRSDMASMGGHLSYRPGRSLTLLDRKEYHPGDSVTDLDYAISLVQRKLMKRRYEESRIMPVALVVDCTESMDYGRGDFTKQEKALLAAGILGTAALENRDPVGTFSVGLARERWLAASVEDDLLMRLLDIHRGEMASFLEESWSRRLLTLMEVPHLVAIFTDLLDLDRWESALSIFVAHHDVVVFITQDSSETVINGEWMMPRLGALQCSGKGGSDIVLETERELDRIANTNILLEIQRKQEDMLRRYGIDFVRCWDENSLFSDLAKLFSLREHTELLD